MNVRETCCFMRRDLDERERERKDEGIQKEQREGLSRNDRIFFTGMAASAYFAQER